MPEQLPLPFTFNPELGFEQFHAGVNAEQVRHLQRTATGAGESLIFLWGEPGSGKTHLLNACCRTACQLQRTVSYLPLGVVRDYGPEMLEGLEHMDLVCLDDLEQIAGDAAWEEALFELFNRLRDLGRDLIATASAPPARSPIRLPDLKTRFGWGLTLRLQALRDEDKLAVLALYARSLGLDLPPQVGRFLLTHHRRDPQTLRALLERLDQASLAAQHKLTIPFVKRFLGIDPPPARATPNRP
ncbi:regulatory inactivation of DnaA Hda protein [Methylomagnum ishizawai]|uniref:Regulatory inactivation of DnaA Hda protein n=1 Tax=Methylomagnum ishizawai TaxID=1760988 RepID=A0A1Y6CVI4_9GAMM|nr:DnaA regulatory inactivator Hda [Methylomagnum ishizawai]SMF94659.1 regulatory inactivation of DnaA Hda protein [Methylomagnum ishizawai]